MKVIALSIVKFCIIYSRNKNTLGFNEESTITYYLKFALFTCFFIDDNEKK